MQARRDCFRPGRCALLALLVGFATLASSIPSAGAAPTPTIQVTGPAEQMRTTTAADPSLVVIGDSVMLGARSEATARFDDGWSLTFDAAVSRRTNAGASVVQAHAALIENHVVIGLGYNDGWAREPFMSRARTVLDELTNVDQVLWLNLADPEGGFDYSAANSALDELASEHANLTILDWSSIAASDPGVSWDGLHLTAHGAQRMVDLIESNLDASSDPPAPVDPKAVCGESSNPTPDPDPTTARGYWLLDDRGVVHAYGAAGHHGDLATSGVTTRPTSMRATTDGEGYWIVDEDGVVHAYGSAAAHGDMSGVPLNGPVRRIEPHPAGLGYWLVASDGGVFTFGDAAFWGSTGALRLNAPVISMSATATGNGYWLVGGDGGVFTFGDAAFWGSTGALALNQPVIDMTVHPTGDGYWLYARDGGVFTFGAASYLGSVPGLSLCHHPDTVAMRTTPDGLGYWIATDRGWVIGFGNAADHGGDPDLPEDVAVIDLAIAR